MFKFDFNIDDVDESFDALHLSADEEQSTSPVVAPTFNVSQLNSESLVEVSLFALFNESESQLATLPDSLSYSPLRLSPGNVLARRDLFDARLQKIAEDGEDVERHQGVLGTVESDMAFLSAPSDLVPGVYEGGLKTWESSLDLVAVLDQRRIDISGKKVFEIGCGTAIPSCYLLSQLLSDTTGDNINTRSELHLQDFNSWVLGLVTVPNLILAWYFSDISSSIRSPEARIDEPGDLDLTADLLDAFTSALTKHRIELKFFSGSWPAVSSSPTGSDRVTQKYDLALTSETVYQIPSLPNLIALLRGAQQSIVAAKVLYFGVGGGTDAFEEAVLASGGQLEHIGGAWEGAKGGVSRKVSRVQWEVNSI